MPSGCATASRSPSSKRDSRRWAGSARPATTPRRLPPPAGLRGTALERLELLVGGEGREAAAYRRAHGALGADQPLAALQDLVGHAAGYDHDAVEVGHHDVAEG